MVILRAAAAPRGMYLPLLLVAALVLCCLQQVLCMLTPSSSASLGAQQSEKPSSSPAAGATDALWPFILRAQRFRPSASGTDGKSMAPEADQPAGAAVFWHFMQPPKGTQKPSKEEDVEPDYYDAVREEDATASGKSSNNSTDDADMKDALGLFGALEANVDPLPLPIGSSLPAPNSTDDDEAFVVGDMVDSDSGGPNNPNAARLAEAGRADEAEDGGDFISGVELNSTASRMMAAPAMTVVVLDGPDAGVREAPDAADGRALVDGQTHFRVDGDTGAVVPPQGDDSEGDASSSEEDALPAVDGDTGTERLARPPQAKIAKIAN